MGAAKTIRIGAAAALSAHGKRYPSLAKKEVPPAAES
jgi:hypothetical protein